MTSYQRYHPGVYSISSFISGSWIMKTNEGYYSKRERITSSLCNSSVLQKTEVEQYIWPFNSAYYTNKVYIIETKILLFLSDSNTSDIRVLLVVLSSQSTISLTWPWSLKRGTSPWNFGMFTSIILKRLRNDGKMVAELFGYISR